MAITTAPVGNVGVAMELNFVIKKFRGYPAYRQRKIFKDLHGRGRTYAMAGYALVEILTDRKNVQALTAFANERLGANMNRYIVWSDREQIVRRIVFLARYFRENLCQKGDRFVINPMRMPPPFVRMPKRVA